MNKHEYKGYIIKVYFWGDSITPMYKFKLYKPRKNWFPKLVWVEDLHREELEGNMTDNFDKVINIYEEELKMWS